MKGEIHLARYLSDFDMQSMECMKFDTVIIGGGLAGLFCALKLPKNMKVAVLCKGKAEDCDSYLAQGGIAASIGDDDRTLHMRDTVTAGCGVNNREAVEILVNSSEEAITDLLRLGVPFDRNADGTFKRSLEGNHSIKRILHVDGDATGKGIMTSLFADCAKRGNIRLLEDTFAIDLATDDGKCIGVISQRKSGKLFLSAANCVMATGGIGQLFPATTNSTVLTGDGVAMAARAGAKLSSLEYIQFHPTALYMPEKEERAFLISEAVRGEGAVLRNKNGERFMPYYDSRLELAPRDIVARAIYDQMLKTGSPCVYLDITAKSRDFLKKRFPTIFGECLKHGIDISKDLIPVAPCEHYFMGGITTDSHGHTNIENLYAAGECASTGVHGANRLASNSLLEAVVFGGRVANDISGRTVSHAPRKMLRFSQARKGRLKNVDWLREHLRRIMMDNAGIIRSEKKLCSALQEIEDVQKREIDDALLCTEKDFETADMYETARLIVQAAANNRHSIGSHYITD